MRIDDILERMTLEEKVSLCSGQNFWQTKDLSPDGLPALFMSDGSHGLRKQEIKTDGSGMDMMGIHDSLPATCFPTAVTSGSSWDESLMERIGAAIGEEARGYEVGLVLGPGVNIKRNPLCGRNFEYISEDPYVSGKMAAAHIRGLQKNGTGACLKHFACNNQELSRFNSDSVLDERTLREIYLTAFEMAVKEAQPAAVMCAYPKINGTHCSDKGALLTRILRDEWGFEGAVVTDWGAMNDRIEGFRAGCDLSMPGGSDYMEKEVVQAVQSGKLPEEAVNASARRVLRLMERAAGALKTGGGYSTEDHHALAREAAESGAVLLKNEGVLPLREGQKVTLIGAMAKAPRYQGAGSSHINPFRVVSPLEAMPECSFAPGCDDRGETNGQLLREAVEAAKNAEVAVVFAGLPDRYESEGFDRDTMKMPDGHIRMIEAVAEANPHTVVVLLCGSAVECPWTHRVSAILYLGLGGQAVGEAARDLLYGRANPSGKLTESWPVRYEDCASSACFGQRDALYMEGIYVGYRYYEKAKVDVRWPFGFGLSYTDFSYADLTADREKATVTVTNTGKRPGAEVVQLYIAAPADSGYRPVRELKGFRKVFLNPGQSETVTFPLDDRSFAIWQEGWVVPGGVYTVQAGPLSAEIAVPGEKLAIKATPWYDRPKGRPNQAEWEACLGRRYAEPVLKKGQFTMDNSVMEMKDHSLIMKVMYSVTVSAIAKGYPKEARTMDNPTFGMIILSSVGSPVRNMQISGGIKGGLFRGLVEMANGHYIRGIRRMLEK